MERLTLVIQDIKGWLVAKKGKRKYLGELLLQNGVTSEILAEDPSLVFGFCRLVQDVDAARTYLSKETAPVLDHWHLASQCFEFDSSENKPLQLYIWGAPNCGKTYFIQQLERRGFVGFRIPYNDDWTGFNPRLTSFLYCDEFKGTIPVHILNTVLEGRPIRLNTKGGGVLYDRRLPVFILSNFAPGVVYKGDHPGFLARLIEVYLVGNARIRKFVEIAYCGPARDNAGQ